MLSTKLRVTACVTIALCCCYFMSNTKILSVSSQTQEEAAKKECSCKKCGNNCTCNPCSCPGHNHEHTKL